MIAPDDQRALAAALEDHRAGRLSQAEAVYRQLLARDPNNCDALHLLGVIAHQVGRHSEAVDLITRAIRIDGSVADYHCNLGEALNALGRIEQAMTSYRTAMRLDPRLVQAFNNLSVALLERGRVAEAEAVLRDALRADPNNHGTYTDLGIVLSRQLKYDEAVNALRQAVKLRPDLPEVYANLGVALLPLHRVRDAIAMFRKALEIQPHLVTALNNLGLALQTMGEIDPALEAYRKAIVLRPDYAGAYSNMLLALHYSPRVLARESFEEHRRWGAQIESALASARQPLSNDPNPERRLRIGYISADFRQHSVAFFLEPLLENCARKNFEVFCYSDVQSPDAVTDRFKKLADQWRAVTGLRDDRVAEIVRGDRIDLLVDLAGHTAGNRLLMFARKPAPVQVNYLAYPDTSGLTAMDYRITDSMADPPGEADALHTETLYRLPRPAWCYRPPKSSPSVVALPAKKNGFVTFGCFNTLPKINDDLLVLWSKVLAGLANSRLVLKSSAFADQATREEMLSRLVRHGIDSSRVTLYSRDNALEQHLRTYGEIDIALDSFPYHGTTTTCDALWMGVPVICLVGDRHVSRVGASLLGAVGLDDFVAHSAEQYMQIAAGFGSDLPRLASLRQQLRERMRQSPLMDAPGAARAIEEAYRTMWKAWCERQAQPSSKS